MSGSAANTDQMVFPAHPSPIGIFFVAVPGLIIVFIGVCFSIYVLPLILKILLLPVLGSCIYAVKNALDEMGQVTLEWSGQGLTVHRILGSDSYYWSHVEGVELYDPGATFGDLGRHEEKRQAIGLFVRDPARKQRPHGSPPDVMVVSRAGEAADKIPKLVERLSNAKRFGGGKDARKLGAAAATDSKGKPAKSSKSSKAFRRTSAAA